jgi:hypothetical protein
MTGTTTAPGAGTPVELRSQRVHRFAGRLVAALDELNDQGGPPLFSLGAEEAAETLVELARAARQLDGLVNRMLRHAESVDVAVEAPDLTVVTHGEPVEDTAESARGSAATSTAAWYAHATVTAGARARRRVKLAQRLEEAYPATEEALAAGRADLDQADVIVTALDRLPEWVDGDERRRAEQHLLGEARRYDARRLRLLARHLLEVVDPEAAEAALAAQVEADAAAADRRTMLTLVDDGAGTCHGTFRIPTLHGAILAKALDALCSPQRSDPLPREVTDDQGRVRVVDHPTLLGQALCQLLERYPVDRLPTRGGLNPTLVITMDHADLVDGLGAATLDTGHPVPPSQVRRLACEAGLVPAVLGGSSQVLDLGRTRRLFQPSQRLALGLVHRTCTAAGCTIPAAWCDAHHRDPWAAGGRTDLADGTLLCSRHHTLVHHPDYTTSHRPDGTTVITRTRRRRT